MAYSAIIVLVLISVILNRFFARKDPKRTWLWTKRLILVFAVFLLLFGREDSSFLDSPFLYDDYNCLFSIYTEKISYNRCVWSVSYSLDINTVIFFLLSTTASIVLWSFWDDYKKRK